MSMEDEVTEIAEGVFDEKIDDALHDLSSDIEDIKHDIDREIVKTEDLDEHLSDSDIIKEVLCRVGGLEDKLNALTELVQEIKSRVM